MLFCDKAAAETTTSATIADAGNIRLGGGYRPAATTTATGTASAETTPTETATAATTTSATTGDAGKIRLGGGYRPAANTADTGKIRLGGGYRPASKDA